MYFNDTCYHYLSLTIFLNLWMCVVFYMLVNIQTVQMVGMEVKSTMVDEVFVFFSPLCSIFVLGMECTVYLVYYFKYSESECVNSFNGV